MTLAVPVMGIATDRTPHAPSAARVWRPVQYLGSKLRALDAIVEAASGRLGDGVLWDAFTGSSVVAQAAARSGFSVWATDAQAASAAFASAMLGVGATKSVVGRLPEVIDHLVSARHPDESQWVGARSRERDLLEAGDYERLIEFHERLPQRWRSDGDWNPRTPLTTTFAGTYLALHQAMALDSARHQLQTLHETGAIDDWTFNAALTCLCHAASEAVHSAGKHFAQPIQPATPGASNYAFVRGRALKDRSVSTERKAAEAARQIVATVDYTAAHDAGPIDVLTVTPDDLSARGVSVVYADPPYTAQQYSRFYHVLETLIGGIAEPIQSVRGATPKGLYPAERYMSPFCSRRQAPRAFERFIATVRGAGADLMLSYSTTGSDSGNQRTVSEADLLTLVADAYGVGNVAIVDLAYGYRQFNHESRRTETTGTGEILIIGTAR